MSMIEVRKKHFTLPRSDERVLILGSTGSGKTTMGAWLLSQAPFDEIPYVIIDYKRDELLNSIDFRRELGLTEHPKEPGLYHIKPNPIIDDDAMEEWLRGIWTRQNVGLYADEALRIPTGRTGSYEGILTQGRALRIPVISLSQRPVDLTRYAFSEANHVVTFNLTDRRDRKKVSEYVPIDPDYELPDYHSIWYNVGHRQHYSLAPVPNDNEIRQIFFDRLKPEKKEPRRKVI
jgi:DNA helicase HerA-like ATPase